VIHGSIGREDRLKVQEAFKVDPEVQVLIATDAAGEGINLQRAHLMVNYDLPWNPNRLEQRFGRIHRIGQTEVCHLWKTAATFTYDLGRVPRPITGPPSTGFGLSFAGDAVLDKKKGVWLISSATICDLIGQNPNTPGLGAECLAAIG
jgi:superfamily II DNA/RNA helicase